MGFPRPSLNVVLDSINLACRTRQSGDLTVIGNPVFTLSCDLSFPGNPSCRRCYPLLILECVRTQVMMTSLGDVKRHLPTR